MAKIEINCYFLSEPDGCSSAAFTFSASLLLVIKSSREKKMARKIFHIQIKSWKCGERIVLLKVCLHFASLSRSLLLFLLLGAASLLSSISTLICLSWLSPSLQLCNILDQSNAKQVYLSYFVFSFVFCISILQHIFKVMISHCFCQWYICYAFYMNIIFIHISIMMLLKCFSVLSFQFNNKMHLLNSIAICWIVNVSIPI